MKNARTYIYEVYILHVAECLRYLIQPNMQITVSPLFIHLVHKRFPFQTTIEANFTLKVGRRYLFVCRTARGGMRKSRLRLTSCNTT